MNLYDFLIIYFACGAPVGVYYFLQNRRESNRQKLFFKTLLAFTIWMPFAFRHLQTRFNKHFGGDLFSDAKFAEKIQTARTRLEKALLETGSNISIYEIRQIFERYISFTLSSQTNDRNSQVAPATAEIFRIAGHNNAELASICLARRNRKELVFHQTLARLDLLDLLAGKANLGDAAIEFVSLLNDLEATEAIEKMFDVKPQTRKESFVKDAEKQIWNSETQKPVLTKMISTRLKALTATLSLREKD
jgi:hypothetical protein